MSSSFDDASALRRLRALYDEHLSARPVETPYEDYGYNFAPNQTFQTPGSVTADPPAQAYGEGGVAKKLAKSVRQALLPEAYNPDRGVFLRFGEVPANERSEMFAGPRGFHERGVSVYDLLPQGKPVAPDRDLNGFSYRFRESVVPSDYETASPRYLVQGLRHGKGYDGEPVIRNVQNLGTPWHRPYWPTLDEWSQKHPYAADTPPTVPYRDQFAGGGAVDTMGGPDYEDYGSGRFTRTPEERRNVRELRQAQWQPPSPEDDWGAREWQRLTSRNPLQYGMEALQRLDSAGRDRSPAEDIRSLLGADHYQRSGLLSDAFVDVGNLLTLGLPGLGRKAVANVAPLVYDVAQELAPEILGRGEAQSYADGGVAEGPSYGYVSPSDIAAGVKPVIPQAGGGLSTEKSIGVELGGINYVIPTIIDGVSYTPDAAVDMFRAGRVAPLGQFSSREAASDFAEQRSRDLDAAFGGEGVLHKGPSSPASGDLRDKPQEYREGGVVDIIKAVRNKFGPTQGRRIEQAADSVNLERFNDKALMDLFDPANRSNTGGGLLAAIPPGDFQDYAKPIPEFAHDAVPYPRWPNVPRSQARGIPKEERGLETYLELLGNRIMDKGLDTPSTLWTYRTLDPMTAIEGHEGRHRMMALDRLGEDRGLVNLRPSNAGELRGDIDERLERLRSKYFPRGGGEMILPEAADLLDVPRRPKPLYAEPFADGGSVLTRIAKHFAGKPKQVRLPSGDALEALPIHEFENVADTFARRNGNTLPTEYSPFDEDRARRLAEAYGAMKHSPLDPKVRRSYDALIDETMDQYKALEGTGAKFEFLRPGEADPYAASPALGYQDLVENGRLKMFPTDSGFGSLTDISDNPLLRRVGRVGDLDNATANDAFRVVHDALGHFGAGNPFFRHQGEERAWRMHAPTFSDEALPALTSETRGQNSWVNFGPHGEHNRAANGADTIYADQKTGLLPEWAYKGYADGGTVKFIKKMRDFLEPEKVQALDKIAKITDKTKNEALIYGNTGISDPLSAITRGDRTGVAIPDWADRFVETSRRQELPWFSAHTHPNNTLSPSAPDLREWGRHLEHPQDMLIGAWPQNSSLQLGSLANVADDPSERSAVLRDIVRRKLFGDSRSKEEAFPQLQGLVDFAGAHGLQIARGQNLSPLLHELESAPMLDYMARRGVPVAMDANHVIPNSGGALAADVYPELMNFYRGKGKDFAPFDLGYKEGGPIGFQSRGHVATDLARKAWKTRRAEELQKEVLELNRGKSKPSDPFTSPDVDPRLQTVADPQRIMFPGIYKDPRDIISDAKSRLLPDLGKDSSMYRLFGHTRDSLDELSQGERRLDDFRPTLGPQSEHPFTPPAGGRGAAVSDQILTPRNANRVTDVLGLALEDPQLRNTRSWYEMTPLWDRATQLGVGDNGPYSKRALNTRLGVMSPASDPPTEIERGMLANYLAHEGRIDDFVRYGGVPEHLRGTGQDGSFPPDMMGMKSHAYHNTAHVPNLLDFESTGRLWSPKHKVPTYVAATDPIFPYGERPVADAHFTRFLGYPDVRTGTAQGGLRKELSGSEYADMFPWWNKKVAGELDLRPRDAQALMWNVGGPQTDVKYIGPSKLEMISNFIDQSAQRLGVSPENARDMLLTGQTPGFPVGKAHGGAVEDDMALWGSQNYADGGSVGDDMLAWGTMFASDGGRVQKPCGYFRR